MRNPIRTVLFGLLLASLASTTACGVYLPQPKKKTTTTTKSTTVKKKKAHPHGGPPGQTKKSAGHPGKRH